MRIAIGDTCGRSRTPNRTRGFINRPVLAAPSGAAARRRVGVCVGAFRSRSFGACGEAPRARREGPRETLPRSRINGGSRIYVNVCVPFALWLVARNPDGPRAGDRSRSGKASPTAF